MLQLNGNYSGQFPTQESDKPYVRDDTTQGNHYLGNVDPANPLTRVIFPLPVTVPPNGWGATLVWNGQQQRITLGVPDPLHPGSLIPLGNGPYELDNPAIGGPSMLNFAPPIPAPPTRADVCGLRMHFRGGYTVQSPTYGLMPWWPAALPWCDAATRQAVYAAMRANGDRHAMVGLPNGNPLYNEPNQFYSPDKFPALDWTDGQTVAGPQYVALIEEVLEQGFLFVTPLDENKTNSRILIKLALQALTPLGYEQYGFFMPGFDGVFYSGVDPNINPQAGWWMSDYTGWAADARMIAPDCYLGMEFNVGHIPLGGGVGDYQPGGLMDGYDVVLGEFPGFVPYNGSAGDNVWQIIGRCVSPFITPPDFIDDGAGSPPFPFYLVNSPRGPRSFCAFEDDNPYNWVRTNMNSPTAIQAAMATIQAKTTYYRGMGCQWVG